MNSSRTHKVSSIDDGSISSVVLLTTRRCSAGELTGRRIMAIGDDVALGKQQQSVELQIEGLSLIGCDH
jgi:hypothetical protein